jgi:hypothetical protein
MRPTSVNDKVGRPCASIATPAMDSTFHSLPAKSEAGSPPQPLSVLPPVATVTVSG